MKKLASCIVHCAVFAALSTAMISAPASADVALWSLKGANGGRAVLMGTVHLLPNTAEWQTERLKSVVDDADMLVLEAVIDGANAAVIQGYAVSNGFYTQPGESLADVLSAADMARVDALEIDMDVPAGTFKRMRPWFAALNMSLLSAMANGFEVNTGAEQWLKSSFDKQGRGVGPLEGPSAGLEALSGIDETLQVEMLKVTLDQMEEGGDYILQLYAAWVSGDLDALSVQLMDEDQFNADVHAALLVQRNANWVTPVLEYLKTPEEELIAVGAAHMVGPGNLIEMLREAGVTVERLE